MLTLLAYGSAHAGGGIVDENDQTESYEEKAQELMNSYKAREKVLIDRQEAQRLLQMRDLNDKIARRHLSRKSSPTDENPGDINLNSSPIFFIRNCLSEAEFGDFTRDAYTGDYAAVEMKGNKFYGPTIKHKFNGEALKITNYQFYCSGNSAQNLYHKLKLMHKQDPKTVQRFIQVSPDEATSKNFKDHAAIHGRVPIDHLFDVTEMFVFGKDSSKKRKEGSYCIKINEPRFQSKDRKWEHKRNMKAYICAIPLNFTTAFFNTLKANGDLGQRPIIPIEKMVPKKGYEKYK
ncbi:MAG: hypothetical protein ACO20H_02900 [Bacteriovoracaceae bacterium]